MNLTRIIHLFRVFLYHPECVICGNPLIDHAERLLCGRCMNDIRPHQGPTCPRCGNFLSDPSDLCGNCRLRPPPFESAWMFAAYEGVFREVILRYKYNGHMKLARYLAGILPDPPDCGRQMPILVPVPEDPGRKREYSPARELCRHYSRMHRIPMRPGALKKIRTTPPQAGLSFPGRMRNLRGAFNVRPADVAGRTVILLDDVVTTGSTVRACAQVMKDVGARVYVIALARTP